MGRSSRQQADANRARIVEIASGLFRARGIEAVSIGDVMKAAGLTQGGFYRHFASKDALAAEACTFAFEQAIRFWRRAAEEARRDGRDVPGALAAQYLAPRAPERTCPMIAFAAEVGRRNPEDPLRHAYATGVRRLFETFEDLAGQPGDPAAQNRLRMLFAGMAGSSLLAQAAGDAAAGFKQAAVAAADAGAAGGHPPRRS